MKPKFWMVTGYLLAVLWAFFFGYFIAISFGSGMSWSVSSVTMFFPEGGLTGGQFVALFRIARWSFVILTFALLLWTLASIMGEK